MAKAVFAGRFDPVTNGHLDIVQRAAVLFPDGLIVAVASSTSTMFSTEERVELLKGATADLKNVTVMPYAGLTVDFARVQGATVLIRSMRGPTDFGYEFDIALMNKKMAPEIESLYLISRVENLFISGTRIREVASLGYDVSELVPRIVAEALKKKLGH